MEDLKPINMDDELMLEEIRGETTKKVKLNILNQKKVSKWDLDELFAEQDDYEEEF